MRAGDHQKAFEQFGSALAHHPDCPKALLGTGVVMQNHKEYDVALAKYKAASAFIPESPSLWNNIGMCFFEKKKLVAAISCLKRASFLSPLEWKILYNLGLVHISSQQYASAFHFLNSAINLEPNLGCAYLPLAITLTHLGEFKKARIAFEKVIDSSPENLVAHLNYSLFLYRQNEISEAVTSYDAFQKAAQSVKNIDASVLKTSRALKQLLFTADPRATAKESEIEGNLSKSNEPNPSTSEKVVENKGETSREVKGNESDHALTASSDDSTLDAGRREAKLHLTGANEKLPETPETTK